MQELRDIEEKVRALKREFVDRFYDHCDSGIYALKLHLLDHMVEDMRRSATLNMLDASPFERFNVYVKLANRQTSQRPRTHMTVTVDAMEMGYATVSGSVGSWKLGRSRVQPERKGTLDRSGPYLVRDGESLGLDELVEAVAESRDRRESRTVRGMVRS